MLKSVSDSHVIHLVKAVPLKIYLIRYSALVQKIILLSRPVLRYLLPIR
jgi:hypothetical protein